MGHIYSTCSSRRIGQTVTRYSRLTSENPESSPGLSFHSYNMGLKGPLAGWAIIVESGASLEPDHSRSGNDGWGELLTSQRLKGQFRRQNQPWAAVAPPTFQVSCVTLGQSFHSSGLNFPCFRMKETGERC